MPTRADATIKTERLLLTPLQSEDYPVWKGAHERLANAINEFDLDRNQVDLSESGFSQMVREQTRQWQIDHSYLLGIFSPQRADFLGHVSLMNIVRENFQNGYLGYRLLNPHWGKGYGQEAVRGLLQFGFVDLRLHRIEAAIEQDNLPSVNLAKRLGMEEEGLSKARLYKRNTWLDMKIFALLAATP